MQNLTDFGEKVKIALIRQKKTQNWLIEQIAKETGLFIDTGYMYKILTGQRSPTAIIAAIVRILSLQGYEVVPHGNQQSKNI